MPSPGHRLANFDRNGVYGYWGPVTANIDWCETNYEVSYYIAEFWNTVTTIAMVLPPIIGGINSFTKRRVELRYILPFAALIVVGLGSGLFHMTLLYEMQLMDELPMIWGTASLLYSLSEVYKVSANFNMPLAGSLLASCLLSTIAYLLFDNRLIFEGTYSVMVFWSIYLGIKAIIKEKSLVSLFVISFLFYLMGFICWCADRFLCDDLQALRRHLLPASLHPFTQFHAWWHVFASFGTYLFILLSLRTRLFTLSQPCRLRLGLGIFPYYEMDPENSAKLA